MAASRKQHAGFGAAGPPLRSARRRGGARILGDPCSVEGAGAMFQQSAPARARCLHSAGMWSSLRKVPEPHSFGATSVSKSSHPGLKSGNYTWNTLAGALIKPGNASEGVYPYSIAYLGTAGLPKMRGIYAPTNIDLALECRGLPT